MKHWSYSAVEDKIHINKSITISVHTIYSSSWVHFSPTGNFSNQIAIGTLESLDGYEIEVRIPWSGLGITPQTGQVYGYAVALSDDDEFGVGEQQTQMSTSPQRAYPNPHHWGNFFLDP